MSEDRRPYITIIQGLRGWFAAHVYWYEAGEYWEIWQTGIGSYETAGLAALEAREWAEAEGVRYVPYEEPVTLESLMDGL